MGDWGDFLPYGGQSGSMEITATSNDGNSESIMTHNLEPQEIPLAENIMFSDLSINPTISWDVMLFDDAFDSIPDLVEVDSYRVRIYNSDFTEYLYGSDYFANNSFEVPDDILLPGQSYNLRLMGAVFDDGATENRSSTFFAFKTDPVPEPSTVLLLGLGLIGLIGLGRKKVINTR